jgi:hypothetical protein
VFKESGPGELSDAELAVDVMLFTNAARPPPPAAAAVSEAAGQAGRCTSSSSQGPQLLALASCVSCAPHRLLAVQAAAPGGASGQGQAGLLLGLSDDVDCALVSAQLSTSADSSAAAAGSSSSSSSAGGWGVVLSHQAYLPALAYVVSGKTQRRHLLLGKRQGQSSSSSCCCCCLILCSLATPLSHFVCG